MQQSDARLDAPIFEVITPTRWAGHCLTPTVHTRLYNAITRHQHATTPRRIELSTVRHLRYTPDAVLRRRVRGLGKKSLAELRIFLQKEGFGES